MGETLSSKRIIVLLGTILFLALAKATFGAGICDSPDTKCTTPSISDWKYNGVHHSLDAAIAAITDNFHKYSQGNCPLNLPTAPWGQYFPNYNLIANVGDGSSFTSVILGEGTYFTSVTTAPVYGTNGGWCPSGLNGYIYLNGGFSPIARSRTLICPSGFSLSQLLYGGHLAYVCAGAKPKKIVVLDPGHGLTCPTIGQASGALGVTDFPSTDPPPGRLREDDLTVEIALEAEQILSTSYKVILTKRDVNTCPTLKQRGEIAKKFKAKAFVSIHINKKNTIFDIQQPFANGTSVLYNSQSNGAKELADQMAASVSSSLGVNNRGSIVRDGLAVLKPTVTPTTAVLVEAARLSGNDEKILHAQGAAAKTAIGIKAALDALLGQ